MPNTHLKLQPYVKHGSKNPSHTPDTAILVAYAQRASPTGPRQAPSHVKIITKGTLLRTIPILSRGWVWKKCHFSRILTAHIHNLKSHSLPQVLQIIE